MEVGENINMKKERIKMRKNICALFVVLLILLMMGCAATTKDAVDVEIKNDSTEVSVDSENETTESSTTEKETVDENTDTPENTEDNKEESEQEPELSEEEKHAALLEKINTQQETCKMLNDMNTGNKYSCFYDESTNTFTYNMDVSGAADFVPSDAFNDLINSTDFSASSNHEYLGIDCYSNFLDGTIVLYSSLNGQRNDDLTLVRLSPDDTEPTFGQKNALSSAESYLAISAFSHSKLIQQLEYEGYSSEEATYAADRCGANWCEQAAKSAEAYLKISAFSKDRLIQQLEYEGFTPTQASYGVAKNGYLG